MLIQLTLKQIMSYMKKLLLAFGLMLLVCKPLWSLPFAPLSQIKKHNLKFDEKINTEKATIDFSGHWQGECNQQKVEDLTIVQKPYSIALFYGSMKEKYQIGELNSTSSSNKATSESSSVAVFWSRESNALVFLHSLSFAARDSSSASVHFSKSSMQLAQNYLLIKTEYYSGANTLAAIQQDTLNCMYYKKTK